MLLKDTETLKFRLEHVLMRVFVSSAFMLWTRYFTVQVHGRLMDSHIITDVLNCSQKRWEILKKAVTAQRRTTFLALRFISKTERDGKMHKGMMFPTQVSS